MKKFLLRWLFPDEVYVALDEDKVPISVHTTLQGATEEASVGYRGVTCVPLELD